MGPKNPAYLGSPVHRLDKASGKPQRSETKDALAAAFNWRDGLDSGRLDLIKNHNVGRRMLADAIYLHGYLKPSNVRGRNYPLKAGMIKVTPFVSWNRFRYQDVCPGTPEADSCPLSFRGDTQGKTGTYVAPPKFSVCGTVRYQCTAFRDAGSGKCLPQGGGQLHASDYARNYGSFVKNEVRSNMLQQHLDDKVRVERLRAPFACLSRLWTETSRTCSCFPAIKRSRHAGLCSSPSPGVARLNLLVHRFPQKRHTDPVWQRR